METAVVPGSAQSKVRVRKFSRVVQESIDFEEDYDLPSDEHEVRRLIARDGRIGLDGNIGELI